VLDLRVLGGIAKAQVAVRPLQGQQMGQHILAVAHMEFTDGDKAFATDRWVLGADGQQQQLPWRQQFG